MPSSAPFAPPPWRGTAAQRCISTTRNPDIHVEDLEARPSAPRGKQTFSNALRKATRLSPAAIERLLHESAARSGNSLAASDAKAAAAFIKAAPVTITAMASIERAISSLGGIRSDALDALHVARPARRIRRRRMLDWEAPTGGYLPQACFATGVAAADSALAWLKFKTG